MTSGAGSARDVTREFVDSRIEVILGSLDDVLATQKLQKVDCTTCGTAVKVAYPDVRAITDLLRLLFDQGYGRPGVESVEQQSDIAVLAAVPAEQRARVLERLRSELAS